MKPPKRKIANKAADPKVLAIVMSRAIAPIIRKRPKAIWCTENNSNIKQKNLHMVCIIMIFSNFKKQYQRIDEKGTVLGTYQQLVQSLLCSRQHMTILQLQRKNMESLVSNWEVRKPMQDERNCLSAYRTPEVEK